MVADRRVGLLLVGFLVVERAQRLPDARPALLRNAPSSECSSAGLLLTFAAFAFFTYTSIWLQSVLGLTPIQAGLIGLPCR